MLNHEEITFVAPPDEKSVLPWKVLILIGEMIEKEKRSYRDYLIDSEEFEEISRKIFKNDRGASRLINRYRTRMFPDEEITLKNFLDLLKRNDFFPFFTKGVPFTARSIICWSSYKYLSEDKIGVIKNIQKFMLLLGIPIEDIKKEGKKLLDYLKKEDYLGIIKIDDSEFIGMTPKAYREILGFEVKEGKDKYETFDDRREFFDCWGSYSKSKDESNSYSFIPSVTLNDLVLDDETFMKIKLYVNALKKDENENFKLILYGPPGTGKTYSAYAIAGELQRNLVILDLSKVLDKYYGETEKILKREFDKAKNNKAIILLDEADAFLKKRDLQNFCHHTTVSYLLKLLEDDKISVIICTNFFEALDEAILRRVDDVIEYKIPEKDERKNIWIKEFEKNNIDYSSIDIENLSLIRLSGGLIKNCVRKFKRILDLNEENVNPNTIKSIAMEELNKVNIHSKNKEEKPKEINVVFIKKGEQDDKTNLC